MAGSVNALLQGFTLPAQYAPMWDHTYVTSSCGYGPWECFGRASGGRLVGSGNGNSFVSECHSYPRRNASYAAPAVYAGISYFDTGVCHQAANRILYPSGALVSKARGYGVTRALWGPFGANGWPGLDECKHVNSTQAVKNAVNGALRVESQNEWTRSNNSMANYDSIAIATAGAPGANFDEMAAFFREQLSRPLPDAMLHRLFEIEVDLRRKQAELSQQRKSREISDREYSRKLNEALAIWKDENMQSLGASDFDLVFGEAGHSPEMMADPAIFPG